MLLINVQERRIERKLLFAPDPIWSTLNLGKHDGGTALAFSADGRYLALGTRSGRIFCWDLPGQKQTIKGQGIAPGKTVAGLLFGPDGRSLLVQIEGGERVTRWDLVGQALVRRAEFLLSDDVVSMGLSPDGSMLACRQKDGTVFLNPLSLTPCRAPLKEKFLTHRFSPDGRFLAAAAENRIVLLDLHTGNRVRTFQDIDRGVAHEYPLDYLEFTPDGALLLSASFNEAERTVKLWEVCSGRLLDTVVVGGKTFSAVALHPRSPLLAVATDERLELHEIASPGIQTLVGRHAQPMTTACFSPDGQFLTGIDRREVVLWSLANGRPYHRRVHSPGATIPSPLALAFHPRGNALSFRGHAQRLLVWDLAGDQPFRELEVKDPRLCAFGPSGKRLWVVEGDTVQSWTWPEARKATDWRNLVFTGLGGLNSLAVTDRWVLAGGRDGDTRLLRPDDGQLEAILQGPGSPVQSLAVRTDGSVAAFGTLKGVVRLVALTSRQTLADLEGHRDSVESLAFTRDGAPAGVRLP